MPIESQGVQIRRQSTTAGSTAQTIAATIAFSAAATSITRSDLGSFVTDGFTSSMRVENNSTANSTRIHTIASVAATVMTIYEAIVAQSTGISITITGHAMEAIGTVTSWGGPNISCSKIDITSLASTSKEFIPSIRDSGDVTVEVVFDTNATALHSAIRSDLETRTKRVYDVRLTDQSTNSTSQPTAFYFDGYITSFGLSGSVDNIIKGSVTIAISSAVKTINKIT